jgi:mRNA-degrading endonuclease RelE of RelBE toxin-antitoxin system
LGGGIIKITVEESFKRGLKQLPPDRRRRASAALVKFIETPDLPGLAFRPLAKMSGFYIIDINRGDRIILRKDAEDIYAAVDVGPHDNVYRRWNRR